MGCNLLVALRYLRGGRRFSRVIAALSVLGMALGVMALLVVMGVMTGFERDLRERILGTNAHLVVLRYGGIQDYERLARRLGRIPGVRTAAPFLYQEAMLCSELATTGVVLRGMEPEALRAVSRLGRCVTSGSLRSLRRGEVLLGQELARQLGVEVGDRLRLIIPFGELTPGGPVPRVERLRVGGTFRVGLYEYDAKLAYVSLRTAQRLLGRPDRATGIEVRLEDAWEAKRVASLLRSALPPGFVVRDWMEMNRSLFSALRVERVTMFVILALIVLVAAFGIVSVLTLSVVERRREIAVLKALGATNGRLMWIFVLQGLMVAVLGVALGTAGGLALGANLDGLARWLQRVAGIQVFPPEIYHLSRIPCAILPRDVATIVGMALLTTLAATLYPAWEACSVEPARALRNE